MKSKFDLLPVPLISIPDDRKQILRFQVPDRAGNRLVLPMSPAVIQHTVEAQSAVYAEILYAAIAVGGIPVCQDDKLPAARVGFDILAVQNISVLPGDRIIGARDLIIISPQRMLYHPLLFLFQRKSTRKYDVFRKMCRACGDGYAAHRAACQQHLHDFA